MKRTLALMVFALAALAQQPPPPEAPRIQKVVQVKYADVDALARALAIFGGTIRPEKSMRLISIEGWRETVLAMEDAIKRLDVPSQIRNVELTFHILAAGPDAVGARPLPADFDGVAKNLTALFGYKSFSLIDVAALRARDGHRAEANGMAPRSKDQAGYPASSYSIKCSASISPSEKGNSIRLDQLHFNIRVAYPVSGPQVNPPLPVQYQFQDMGFSTQIDVREGQKVVVGKANMNSSDSALILVVTAKAVD
ncbi:MAG: hypothetical protein JJE04_00870 [Acidobacteriia bacterium]|nr:hypothetical protein [Terriglobia bacterium]